METSNQTSDVGVAEKTITRLPITEIDSETTTDVATRTIGSTVEQISDDSEFGEDVIRIRLVFDGDDLSQILMVDPASNEVEWVRAVGAQNAMRNSA